MNACSAIGQPDRTTLMIKPVGAMCNLRCAYCYYLPTLEQWGGHERRMSLDTLERLFAGALPRWGQHVTIAWQGGEPLLAGREFFEKALELQARYARPGQRVENAIQTNGTLLDQKWCQFMRDHEILVGISIDGPTRFHDHYRVTPRDEGSNEAVLDGLELLKKHRVEHNVLCVLNDRNVDHPDELLGYFLNRGVKWLQFIPAIEWGADGETGGPRQAGFSPSGEAYGRFLCRLFDRWFDRHRGEVSIRFFDSILMKLVRGGSPFCMLAPSCHSQITVEHDGSVFGCDHFVEPRWRLGVIEDRNWPDRLDGERLAQFARRKSDLPDQCRQCEWLSLCHGGCPKHRPNRGEMPEPTTLCAGYRMFFDHAMARLQWLADYLKQGEQPPPPRGQGTQFKSAARNAPCPCGSGRKYKQCHGKAVRA